MYVLLQHQNRNSAVRADGRRGWYHPSRNSGIRNLVVHTTENDPSEGGARRVALWQARTAPAPSSYHVIVDAQERVNCLPENYTAFHVRGYNSSTLGVSFATRAGMWGRNRQWDEAALKRGAAVVAEWCGRYNIPPIRVTRSQVDRGVRGVTSHATLDPGRRSDPGPKFPWTAFLKDVSNILNGTSQEEEEETMKPEQLNALVQAITESAASTAAEVRRLRTDVRALTEVSNRNNRSLEAVIARSVSQLRESLGLPSDPESDRIWAERISIGRAEYVDVVKRLTEASEVG